MSDPIIITMLAINLALLLGVFVFLIVLAKRLHTADLTPLSAQIESLLRDQDRTERAMREEIAKSREEASSQARSQRAEVIATLKGSNDTVVNTLGQMSTAQEKRLETFSQQLGAMSESLDKKMEALKAGVEQKLAQGKEDNSAQSRILREEVGATLKGVNDTLVKTLGEVAKAQHDRLEGFATQIAKLAESNDTKMEVLRAAVEQKLGQLQDDNSKKLEEMRKTVDEKLHGTLEKRLGEAFSLVNERLEQVHKGLGEMQTLASGVGDLKKVLTNVKVRGTLGEWQLGNLLEQILSPEQYASNVATREGSDERVEFAIRLPGKDEMEGKEVWLPLDAKFPTGDYERLVEASENGDVDGVAAAGQKLEATIRGEAKKIRDKYLDPPHTTDFGIMFLPYEGLFAEVLRRPGLVAALQQEYRVSVTGPTTLAALLNSLQMGFRTLAIQKRSSEVWTVLGAVKTEFGKFGEILDKVKKKIDEASSTIDSAAIRTRSIQRKLRTVEELPAAQAQALLGPPEAPADEAVDGGPENESPA